MKTFMGISFIFYWLCFMSLHISVPLVLAASKEAFQISSVFRLNGVIAFKKKSNQSDLINQLCDWCACPDCVIRFRGCREIFGIKADLLLCVKIYGVTVTTAIGCDITCFEASQIRFMVSGILSFQSILKTGGFHIWMCVWYRS